MKINKRLILCLSMLVFAICLTFSSNIYGASVSLSASKITAEVGDTITINVNVSSAATWQITATSTGAVTNTSKTFVRSDDGIEDVSKSVGTLSLTANSVGTGTISLSGNAYTSSGSPIGLGAPITITVKEKAKPVTPQAPSTNTNNNNNQQANTVNKNTNNNNKTNTNTSKNNNAYLSKLQVNQEGLTPNFNKNKTNYSITVGENVNSLKVTAMPEASTSKVSISGNNDLKIGDNKIYVTVTAQDGTKKVYTITVTKTADPVKSNSYLQNLIVENATLSPEFSKEVFEYDCGTVGASVESLKILTFGENENVKVEITGNDKLVDGENTITVKVTSEDSTTTKEYIIKVKKDSNLVEEEIVEEINLLIDTEDESVSGLKKIWNNAKSNWLLILMYMVVIVEFVQIVYLYRHQEKRVKTNIKNKDVLSKKEVSNSVDKNISLDKQFKQKRKQNKKIEDLENDKEESNITNSKKRNGAIKFDE